MVRKNIKINIEGADRGAHYEINKIFVLTKLFQNFTFKVSGQKLKLQPLITLRPKTKLKINFQKV